MWEIQRSLIYYANRVWKARGIMPIYFDYCALAVCFSMDNSDHNIVMNEILNPMSTIKVPGSNTDQRDQMQIIPDYMFETAQKSATVFLRTAGELEDFKEFSHSTILYMREGRFLKALEIVNIKLTMSIKDPSKLFTASDEYKRFINMGTEAVLGVCAPNSYTV